MEVNFCFQVFGGAIFVSARNGKRNKYCCWGTLGNIYSGWEKKTPKNSVAFEKVG